MLSHVENDICANPNCEPQFVVRFENFNCYQFAILIILVILINIIYIFTISDPFTLYN